MSGSQRGTQLYRLMSNGETAPNGIVNDLIAESMVKSAEGNDVRKISTKTKRNCKISSTKIKSNFKYCRKKLESKIRK